MIEHTSHRYRLANEGVSDAPVNIAAYSTLPVYWPSDRIVVY